MSDIVTIVFWFAFCLYASIMVARRVEIRRDRIAYYLLIWLVPVIGAQQRSFLVAGQNHIRPHP